MKTTVKAPLVHECPFRNETDYGRVELTFDGPAPELHGLAELLRGYASVKVTHEDLTAQLATETGAEVVTFWTTAGMEVEVRA